MNAKRSLRSYRSKRDFRRTPEPADSRNRRSSARRFVVHKHVASRLHYDVRLQIGRVLKSWAVPKGPSVNPKVKRLAVEVEDHPLDYAEFEGVIPKGEYGSGTVMVWDKGTYRNISQKHGKPVSLKRAIAGGHASIWLDGKKLKGGFALIHTKKPKKENWLLIKMDDKEADARRKPLKTEVKSALSGRTMKQIAREEK